MSVVKAGICGVLVVCGGCGGAPPKPAAPPVATVAPPPSATTAREAPPEPKPPAPAGTVLERIAQGVGSPCRESKLPAKYHGPPVPLASNLGRGLALSLPRRTVTVDTQGQRTVVVYRSYALDPSSELGDAGYRLQLRDAGGVGPRRLQGLP